jgi:hypothetical protein
MRVLRGTNDSPPLACLFQKGGEWTARSRVRPDEMAYRSMMTEKVMVNVREEALREAVLLQRDHDAARREYEEARERFLRAKARLDDASRKVLAAYRGWVAIQRAQPWPNIRRRFHFLFIVRSS